MEKWYFGLEKGICKVKSPWHVHTRLPQHLHDTVLVHIHVRTVYHFHEVVGERQDVTVPLS